MKNSFLISGIFALFTIASCSTSTEGDPTTGNAKVTVKLTDAPALYDAVNIDVQKIEFNTGNGRNSINVVNPSVYNLLNFRN